MFLDYTYYKNEENVKKKNFYDPMARNTHSVSLK